MVMREEELKKAVEKAATYLADAPDDNSRIYAMRKLQDARIELLEYQVEEMDKYLDTLGTENTDLKERIEKLENLTDPES